MTAAMTTTTETALPTTLEWSIDPAHTQVGFSVKHLMITNVKGRFPQVSGTVGLDPATSQPEVDVSIDANSITTGDPKRDAHLRSAEDRKSTRLNSSHSQISYAVFCLKKKKNN